MDYLGVDYGTTTSLLTKYVGGDVSHAVPPIPSCVAVAGSGEIICGETALNEHLGDRQFVALPSVPLIQNLNIVSLNKLMGQNAPKRFVPS